MVHCQEQRREIRLPVFAVQSGENQNEVENVAKEAQKTLIATNNHYKGQAAVNAIELKSMLAGKKVKAPKPLVEHYLVEHYTEQLGGIAEPT